MIEVVVVAPYASVRAGLRVLVSSFDNIAITDEARDSEGLELVLAAHRPDAVLYDASTDELSAVLAISAEQDLPFVALCDDLDDVRRLARRIQRGWCALQRSAGADEIAAGIQAAVSGIVAIDPVYLRELSADESFSERRDDLTDSGEVLTPREREVLQLMTHGLPNKVIAARLHISLSTAKFHVASILAKLEAASRTEAVTIGARRGLVSL